MKHFHFGNQLKHSHLLFLTFSMIYCLVYLKIKHSFQKHCQHIFRELKLHIPKQFTETDKKKEKVFHICFFIYIINFRCSKLFDLFVYLKDSPAEILSKS